MPKRDTYIAPPYPSMGGHIVALCGITDDGRVIVTDSATTGGSLLQWLTADYEKIWMRNKGGVVVAAGGNTGALDVVMKHAEGNQSRAAQWLGINRNTLRRKLLDHKLIK
jgi:transcriptional regulator of acetoin/glycerol metabolism